MQELYRLKEMLCDALADYGKKKELTSGMIGTVDTLAHACKNVCKIIEECEGAEYSNRGGSYYSRGYDRGYDRAMDGRSYRDMSYDDGYSNRWDSMGRYSRSSDIREEIQRMAESATDAHTKRELQMLLGKME